MSKWAELKIADVVTGILRGEIKRKGSEHLKRPYMTPYQIAIALVKRHPEVADKLGLEIGGKGTKLEDSIARYIAAELSKRIKKEEILHIEGGLLSKRSNKKLSYTGDVISSTGQAYDLSMYRLRST